jgi:glutathione peroxidase
MNPRKNRLLDLMPALALLAAPAAGAAAPCSPLLAHEVSDIAGGSENLCQYAGKVVLVVNTASYCGYTPQYKGLQALNEKYKSRGLVILGFPSNDFGNQEPGSGKEIAEFCENTFGVKFPMFAKSRVVASAGSAANPLFAELAARTGQWPKWNFHKYVIARDGSSVTSFASDVDPQDRAFTALVDKLLAAR